MPGRGGKAPWFTTPYWSLRSSLRACPRSAIQDGEILEGGLLAGWELPGHGLGELAEKVAGNDGEGLDAVAEPRTAGRASRPRLPQTGTARSKVAK
jgi:hypothetical protein